MDFTAYKVGDRVRLSERYGGIYAGKIGTVLQIKKSSSFGGGFGVLTDIRKGWMGASWYDKIDDKEIENSETRLLVCLPNTNMAFFYFG